MRRHLAETPKVIEYEREDNIHAVQTFCGEENGRALRYNPDDNEYYLHGTLLKRGDLIAKDTKHGLRVLLPYSKE